MKLYIYCRETEEFVGDIDGNTNNECELKAEELFDSNEYYYSYTKQNEYDGKY